MSAMPATAATRATSPSARPPAQRRAPAPRTPLRLVPPARARQHRAPFVVLLVTLLASGLVGLLMLNTVLAQDAFVLHDLKRTVATLTDQQQALMQDVAAAQAPEALAARARALGMVESPGPVFIRLADGRVLGVATPASSAGDGGFAR